MKVRSSLKNLKTRDRNNKLIKRKGRLYVINKRNPRMKARQGWQYLSVKKKKRILLIADHASNYVPNSLENLS